MGVIDKDSVKNNLCSKNICLRRLLNIDSDYKLLEKWYKEKEIYSNFEQRILNYKEVVEKYYPRTLLDSKVPVYIIEYEGKPVGIIQYQLINVENEKLYKIENDNSYEIDIFIGELYFHNKGIGAKAIKLLVNYLSEKRNSKIIVMCPLKENISAIRCYEKVGFKINDEFITEDTIGNIQNYIVMILENK